MECSSNLANSFYIIFNVIYTYLLHYYAALTTLKSRFR